MARIKIGENRSIELLDSKKDLNAKHIKIGAYYGELTDDISKTNGKPLLKLSKDRKDYYIREKFYQQFKSWTGKIMMRKSYPYPSTNEVIDYGFVFYYDENKIDILGDYLVITELYYREHLLYGQFASFFKIETSPKSILFEELGIKERLRLIIPEIGINLVINQEVIGPSFIRLNLPDKYFEAFKNYVGKSLTITVTTE